MENVSTGWVPFGQVFSINNLHFFFCFYKSQVWLLSFYVSYLKNELVEFIHTKCHLCLL